MIIYLEGPDGSGKSTLSDAITNELIKRDLPVIQTKDGKCDIDTHPRSQYRNTAPQLIMNFVDMAYKDAIYVLDRGPVSDVVYRQFDEYEPVINSGQLYCLLNMTVDKVYVVYCRTDVAEEKMLERGDDNPIAIKKHKEIAKAYDELMSNMFGLPYNIFDYTDQTAEDFAKDIVDKVEAEYV